MSDDNPFLVDAFFVSHDNYAARKNEIRNLTLELALIAHHVGVSLPDYGFTKKGYGKIYQWDPTENDMIYDEKSWMEHYKNLAKNTGSEKKIEEEATKIWEAMYTNITIPGLTYTRSKDNNTQKMSGKIELHNILTSDPISKEKSLCDAIWDRINVRDNLISERTTCEKAKESLQKNIEKLETENAILNKMHATQTEEQEKLTEQITDLEGDLSDVNQTLTHYQEENKKYKKKIFNFEKEIENLKEEMVDYKNSEKSKIENIKKNAREVTEELREKITDQYQSKFDELKQTYDANIAKLQEEISELKKQNQPKK